eukprot:COSAG02_NODE_308_length_25072_cov_20.906925_4_plen_253_part_00
MHTECALTDQLARHPTRSSGLLPPVPSRVHSSTTGLRTHAHTQTHARTHTHTHTHTHRQTERERELSTPAQPLTTDQLLVARPSLRIYIRTSSMLHHRVEHLGRALRIHTVYPYAAPPWEAPGYPYWYAAPPRGAPGPCAAYIHTVYPYAAPPWEAPGYPYRYAAPPGGAATQPAAIQRRRPVQLPTNSRTGCLRVYKGFPLGNRSVFLWNTLVSETTSITIHTSRKYRVFRRAATLLTGCVFACEGRSIIP